MPKAVIPNIVGHYEMSGFEIDVYDKQIVIRTSGDNRPRQENHHEPNKKETKKESTIADDLGMGPITRRILGLK